MIQVNGLTAVREALDHLNGNGTWPTPADGDPVRVTSARTAFAGLRSQSWVAPFRPRADHRLRLGPGSLLMTPQDRSEGADRV
jgi:hypothetical protein